MGTATCFLLLRKQFTASSRLTSRTTAGSPRAHGSGTSARNELWSKILRARCFRAAAECSRPGHSRGRGPLGSGAPRIGGRQRRPGHHGQVRARRAERLDGAVDASHLQQISPGEHRQQGRGLPLGLRFVERRRGVQPCGERRVVGPATASSGAPGARDRRLEQRRGRQLLRAGALGHRGTPQPLHGRPAS